MLADVEDPTAIPDMSMREFLELSLLSMFNNNQLDREVPVVAGGVLYFLHMCVRAAVPGEQVNNLERKQ